MNYFESIEFVNPPIEIEKKNIYSKIEYFPAIILSLIGASLVAGYMISCLAKNYQTALVLSTPLTFPLLLFGGFYMKPGWVSRSVYGCCNRCKLYFTFSSSCYVFLYHETTYIMNHIIEHFYPLLTLHSKFSTWSYNFCISFYGSSDRLTRFLYDE